jgi:hypothetical protein
VPGTPTPPETPAAAVATTLGETALDGGFRRVSKGPEPLALARLRALLLELATSGSETLREGLAGLESWSSLAALCGTEWSAGARRASTAARRVFERRLRALGAAPIPVARAASLPLGSAVHVRGIISPVSPLDPAEGGLKSHIWSHSAMNTDNVRLTLEEGHDFFLTDEEEGSRQTACVIAARGHLINAVALVPGDRVSVFGFTDRDATFAARAARVDRGGAMPALRAGDDVPLLIRRLAQEASAEDRSRL